MNTTNGFRLAFSKAWVVVCSGALSAQLLQAQIANNNNPSPTGGCTDPCGCEEHSVGPSPSLPGGNQTFAGTGASGGGPSGALRAPEGLNGAMRYDPGPQTSHYDRAAAEETRKRARRMSAEERGGGGGRFGGRDMERHVERYNQRNSFDFKTHHNPDPNPNLGNPAPLTCALPRFSNVGKTETDTSKLDAGVKREFTISNEKGEAVKFRQIPGVIACYPTDGHTSNRARVELLNDDDQPEAETPTKYRYFNGSGSYIDYPVAQNSQPTAVRGPTGRDMRNDRLKVLINQTSGAYEQMKMETGLVDVVLVDDFAYEMRFYTEANAGSSDPATGKFSPAGEPYRVIRNELPDRNYNSHNFVRVIDTHGSYENVKEFRFVPAAKEWARTTGIKRLPDGSFDAGMLTEQIIVNEQTITRTDPVSGQQIQTKEKIKTTELRDENGELVSKDRERQWRLPFGNWAVMETVKDVDGAALTTTNSYYEDLSDRGSLGKKKETVSPDGSWMRYAYDSQGRVTSQIAPWLDSAIGSPADQAKETVYSYTPVDSNDTTAGFDARARTEIEYVLGVESKRTYAAYYNDPVTNEFTEVVERATVQGAAYEASSNLRTVKVYYAADEPEVLAGRLKQIAYANGTLETHSYEEVGSPASLIETIDILAADGTPVASKSKRRKLTMDPQGNLVKEENFIYDGSAWQLYATLENDYSEEITMEGPQLLARRLNGRTVLEQVWSGPLVVGSVNESGIAHTYLYDALDELEFEIKAGHNGAPDVTTHYQHDHGGVGCGCDGAVTTEITAGGITLTSTQKTDSAGRRSETIDQNGYSTTYSYVDDRRITTATLPSGATRITENYLDGRVKSVTGTGVIPEHYSYTVNADGSATTRTESATQGSPRFREMTYDIAGRMIRDESPAFTGGVVSRSMTYNALGLLASRSETGRANTLYQYDALANMTRSGLDVDGSGSLELASNDRITDADQLIEQDASNAWFEVRTTKVYPEAGASTAVQVGRTARRLSGFALAGVHGDLVSELTTTDVHGNDTVVRSYVNRATKTQLQIVDTPVSTIDVVRTTVNGLLVSENTASIAAPVLYGYDAVERRVSVKHPRHTQASQTTYMTNKSQIFEQINAAGNATTFSYVPQGVAGAGQLASVTDALLQKSYRSYDLLGRQIRTWGAIDYPLEYSYNNYGERATLTTWRDTSIDFSASAWPDPTGGDVTTWSYQPTTGLLTRKEYADGNGIDYAYDSANRLSTRTWARNGGLDTTYSYDSATAELLSINYKTADTADVTYAYDRLGRRSNVTDATGTRSFVYDPATLQLTEEQLDSSFYQSHKLTRGHDSLGRASGYSLKDGGRSSVIATTYGYETTGRLATVGDGTDTFTYRYAANSSLLSGVTAPQHTVSYGYEVNRNVMTTVENQIAGNSYSKYVYSHDVLGRRTGREQSGSAFAQTNTDTFVYNSRSEVIGSTNDVLTIAEYTPSYTYDQIGNRKSSTGAASVSAYVSNELNQYTAINGTSPTYDLDGNLLSNGTWTYSWNNENRLKSATNGSTTIDFLYDYMGRLVEKDDGTKTEVYVYDGWSRIATFLRASNLTLHSSYLWGLDLSGSMQSAGGVGGLLKESEFASNSQLLTSRFCVYDANGNITQKLDGAGVEVMNVDYDPFGNIIRGVLDGQYGYSTKQFVRGIQMYYYGFRYYDPVTGRWPSRDPIGENGGLNVYGMVRNSPVNFWDILGLSCQNVDPCSQSEVDQAVQDLLNLLNSPNPDEAAIQEASQDILDFAGQQQDLAEGWEGLTLNLGIGGNAAAVLGLEGSLDLSISIGDQFEDFDLGLSGSYGGQFGVNLGADAHISLLSGSVQDQEGGYGSVFGNIGPVSLAFTDNDLTYDPFPNVGSEFNPFDGAQLGLGVGAPAGFGVSAGQTHVISLQGIIDSISECFR